MAIKNRKWVAKPLDDYETPRRCTVCLAPATRKKFQEDDDGRNLDMSSRRFVCNEH